MSRQIPIRKLVTVIIVAVLGMLAIGGGVAYQAVRTQDETDRADQAADGLQEACGQVEALGGECAVDPDDFRGEQGPQGEAGPAPTDEQVFAAVTDYFSANPVKDGEMPSAAKIAAAVSNYLRANPPSKGDTGPPPTSEQVATAVQRYLTANPPEPGPQGEKGETGEPGPALTAEQIADAVRQYLVEHPLPMCREGYEAQAVEGILTTSGTVDALLCVAV